MAQKHISGRQLRHGSPEESLWPGESLTVTKRGGKEFQLRRTDSSKRDINAQIDQLFKDIPPEAPRVKTDLVRVLLEDRECQDTIAFALGMKASLVTVRAKARRFY
jgi:hypothetical protein